MITNSTAQQNIAKLPQKCVAPHPYDGSFIIIKTGEMGFYPAPMITSQELADKMNASWGVSAAHIEAMVSGSCFGWEVPAANVDNYKIVAKLA